MGLSVRSEYYETNEEAMQERAGEAELIVAKQRNGPTGDGPLIFLKEYTRFENRAREHASVSSQEPDRIGQSPRRGK